MGNGRKTEEQLTQEIMQKMTQLYEQFGDEPEKIKEAMQTEIASILTSQEPSEKRKPKRGEEKRGRFELTDKGKEAMIQAMSGKEPKKIAEDLGMSKSGVFAVMQREGIMTKSQVIDLIEAGMENYEIHEKGKWTIDAIENTRRELIEKQERKEEARRISDRKRKEKMKEERKPGIEAKQKIKEKRAQQFREALALGLSTEEIATQFGFKRVCSVRVKKCKEGLLGRKEIMALLEEHTDAEIATLAGIENVDIIAQIRQEEQNGVKMAPVKEEKPKEAKKAPVKEEKPKEAKKAPVKEEKTKEVKNAPVKEEKAREVIQPKKENPVLGKIPEGAFLKLAQNLTSVKRIAKQLNMTEEQVREALYDYNIFTKEEVIEWLDSKSDVQIAIMGNLSNQMIVRRVREDEEDRKLIKGIEGDKLEKPVSTEAQKKKEDEMFFRMARNYELVEKIGSAFNMNEYRVILKLRKLNLYSRAEVERMIEGGEISNLQITGEKGNSNAVDRIRRKIQKREKLIKSIPEKTQTEIRRKLSTGVGVSNLASSTRVSPAVITAIQEKYKRDKDMQTAEERRRVNFKIEWKQLEGSMKNLAVSTSNYQKDMLQYKIEKILVMYEPFLTQLHYAYMAYVYMKIGKYIEGIEFTEDYLGLEESTTDGVKARINAILENEKNNENAEKKNTSQDAQVGFLDFDFR